MTSHIRVPALDPDTVATFSHTILGDVLRGRLGFDGVVVTDALDMIGASGTRGIPAAAVAAVAAGADLLCLGSDTPEREVDDIVDALVNADLDGDLPTGRLADAADRCVALARWAADRRRTRPPDTAATREPVVSARRVAASFTLSARAETVLAKGAQPVRWVQIEPEPNVAVGRTPLGPFFEGGAVPSLVVPIDDRALADDYFAEPGVLTVVVGRELHRDEGALAAATTIAGRSEALVVDVGFTHSDQVDIATFGASRLVGEALLELLKAPA